MDDPTRIIVYRSQGERLMDEMIYNNPEAFLLSVAGLIAVVFILHTWQKHFWKVRRWYRERRLRR